MKGLKIATVMLFLLMLAMSMMPAGAEVDITVTTDGDVDLAVLTGGDGALLSVDYNGRDLLAEIAQKIELIEQLRSTIILLAARNDVADLENQLEGLEGELQRLVDELNLVLNDVYYKLGTQAHVIGINPGNTNVALTLISGNATVADYLDEILVDLNATDREFTSIKLQFENVYSGLMVHDTVLMETRSDVRGLETSFEAEIADVVRSFMKVFDDVWDNDKELKSQIDLQGMDVEELREEVSQVYEEFMRERATRNNLMIMFVGFSVIVILTSVVTNRK